MENKEIVPNIFRVGVLDEDIDLFEGQYPVPHGVSYNSYLIMDKQVALLDTVDARKGEEWMPALREALDGREIDYLIISHMEPDHAGSIRALVEAYPRVTLVGNSKTFFILEQFAGALPDQKRLEVSEGSTLPLGRHTLRFLMAPMVHWPEVMVSYEESERLLFSADALGTFGPIEEGLPWEEEARRYYFNIVGKYGVQVQALLRKAAALEISGICPLHGPALTGEAMHRALELYGTWSSYAPQERGVLVAYAGFHGHTAEAAAYMAECLKAEGEQTELIDLARIHKSYPVAQAFRFDRMVLAATTYDGAYASAMEAFLGALKHRNYQKRTVALIENGSWAPMAAKHMRQALEGMKNVRVLDEQVTLRSAMNEQTREQIEALARTVAAQK